MNFREVQRFVEDLGKNRWMVTDKQCTTLDVLQYKHAALDLISLKHASDTSKINYHKQLISEFNGPNNYYIEVKKPAFHRFYPGRSYGQTTEGLLRNIN